MVMTTKSMIWVVTPCSSLEVHHILEECINTIFIVNEQDVLLMNYTVVLFKAFSAHYNAFCQLHYTTRPHLCIYDVLLSLFYQSE
jgi:hypothetical protein